MPETLELDERIRLGIKIGESHYREFKSAFDGPPDARKPRDVKTVMTDVARTLVAFANSDGGELLIGVEVDGRITGIPGNSGKISAILEADRTHVHADTPLPSARKTALQINVLTVAYFSVPKGTQFVHLTSDGRA
jgi:ATP-dependent DNA helicase RecG